MARIGTALWLILLQLGASGCGKPPSGKPPTNAPAVKLREEPRQDAKLAEALRNALVPKLSGARVSVAAVDVDPEKPAEMVEVELLYGTEDSLNYKRLLFRARHQIGGNRVPRTTVMAEDSTGEDVLKLITMSFNDDGRIVHSDTTEKDKDNLRFLEKRCTEIRDVLVGTLPKTPHLRN